MIESVGFHEGQIKIIQNAKRYNAVACGRRFGKTAMGIALATIGWPGHFKGLIQGYDVGWFAPNYKLLDEAWRNAKHVLGAQSVIKRTDAQQHRMELTTGAALDFWTLEDPDGGRGRRYGIVIVDEAAMARHLQQAWDAAIRPTMTDYQGGAWFFSTPKGRNFFWELHQRSGSTKYPDWASHHAPTTANPHIDKHEVEEARRSLPERVFAQEYMAQFLEDGGGVFRRVTDAIDNNLKTDPYTARDTGDGTAYVIGVDWGRHNDFTVFTTIDARRNAVVAIDRFTDIDYSVQLSRLQALHLRFPRAPILAESNSMGGPLIEQLQRMRLPVQAFHTSAASKTQAIEGLALAFENASIRLPNVPWLIDELMAFDQERLPSGMMRYGAPRGGHDDGVMSLAIAWSGVNAAMSESPAIKQQPRQWGIF